MIFLVIQHLSSNHDRPKNENLITIKWWFISHYFISPNGAVLSILIDFHAACYPLKVMRSLNYLGDVKFIASALSLSKRGRHPGLPTKFR